MTIQKFKIRKNSLKIKQFKNDSQAQWPMSVIIATWGAEIRRITIPGQSGQKKFTRPHLSRKRWACWCAPVETPSQQKKMGLLVCTCHPEV
jgi:hypothetical protein